MLSRLAESLYWIGRYVERADATARMLDVHVTRPQDEPGTDQERVLRGLLGVMGVELEDATVTVDTVVERLAFDHESPSSITASVQAARENARGARENLSAEVWEALNVSWHGLAERRAAASVLGPHVFFKYVRERMAMVSGLVFSVMVRDDGWRFLTLGTALERVDMVARLLSTPALAQGRSSALAGLLRSVGGQDTFARVYQGALSPANVAEFLLRDRLSPRSVAFASDRRRDPAPASWTRSATTGWVSAMMRADHLAGCGWPWSSGRRPNCSPTCPVSPSCYRNWISQTSDEVTNRYFGKSLFVRWAAEVST